LTEMQLGLRIYSIDMNRTLYRNPLRRPILMGCISSILILCTVMGVFSFLVFSRTQQYKSHIIDIIYLTMSRIDVKELEHCMDTKAPTKEYEELLKFLDQTRLNYNIERIAISRPVKNGEDYDVMMVASGFLHEERLRISRKNGLKVPLLGDMIGSVYPAGFPALM